MKRFYISYAVLGIIIMLDGILSILFQLNDDLMYQEVRITRIIIGILIIHTGNHQYPTGLRLVKGSFRMDSAMLGIILIIDGIISILIFKNQPLIFQIGRYIRVGIGVLLIIGNFILVSEKKIFTFFKND